MKPSVISADVLFEDHRAALRWQWIAGLGASERRFDEVAVREAQVMQESLFDSHPKAAVTADYAAFVADYLRQEDEKHGD